MCKIPTFFNIFRHPVIGDKSNRQSSEAGFTYIEVIISMVILTVGILGAMEALTYSLVYMQEAEKRTQAKELAYTTLETIYAVRDIQPGTAPGGLSLEGWDLIENKTPTNQGIFLADWTPVRQSPGNDGVYGTADDACEAGGGCSTSAIVDGYERKIEITNIVENGSPVIRKRRIDVTIRYTVNNSNFRTETVSTIIANLPFNLTSS